MGIIVTILVGALIGYLASIIMKSKNGFWMSCLIGVVGSLIGSWLAGLLKVGNASFLWSIIEGVAGSCILIAIVRAIMGKKF